MNSPLNRLFRGLLATLALTCLTGQGWSQAAPGGITASPDQASASDVDAPSDSRDPVATSLGGGAMSSGPAGDVVKGGDSGGQDLPPDLGGGGGSGGDDDDTDDDDTGVDDVGDSGAGDARSSGGRDPVRAAGVMMILRVTVASPDGVVIRTVRLALGPHGARSTTIISSARHLAQGAH